jgi:hypothetical protein
VEELAAGGDHAHLLQRCVQLSLIRYYQSFNERVTTFGEKTSILQSVVLFKTRHSRKMVFQLS